MYDLASDRSYSDQPKRRPLKIYASDPMTARNLGNQATVAVPHEPLKPGPTGQRVKVIDYNSTTGHYYPPVNLDDPALLMQGGLQPSESDPRFHQQMVYAVAMRTLENFDRALGRPIFLNARGQPLRIFPHAFYGANAYYDKQLNALVFGYFRADGSEPGENLPGQMVFTCLSHDIIAHEMTHAIVNRLKRHFMDPSNADVLAFHEGFSDIVALFQHFSFADVVKEQIERTGPNLREARDLLGLARQFGHATASGKPLRSALLHPEKRLTPDLIEPHERGALLVAAVFDGFITAYERRTADLLRLSADTPYHQIHPDITRRLAHEAAKIAQAMLVMCIRAFDYMPPVDVTFGDFLRAIVTADVELSPEDEMGYRAAIIEGFRIRGIFPSGAPSLAEESLIWNRFDSKRIAPIDWDATALLALVMDTASRLGSTSTPKVSVSHNLVQSVKGTGSQKQASPSSPNLSEITPQPGPMTKLAESLHAYATANARQFSLASDEAIPIAVEGVHPVFRVSPNGRLVVEIVAQITQLRKGAYSDELGGLEFRGGTTLIFDFAGNVKFSIAKGLPHDSLEPKEKAESEARLRSQMAFVAESDMRDAMAAYLEPSDFSKRAKIRGSMATLHFVR